MTTAAILEEDTQTANLLDCAIHAVKRDFCVRAFHDLKEYLRFLDNGAPDIALIGVGESGLDGHRASILTRSRCPDCRIVWMNAQGRVAVDAFREGVDSFLLLPVEQKRLKIILGNLGLI